MNDFDRLMSIASAPLSEGGPVGLELLGGEGLGELLSVRNGFYAFESALHVYPATSSSDVDGRSLAAWNDARLWKSFYDGLAPVGVCFAEDAFGAQFSLYGGAVYRFDQETSEMSRIADSVHRWIELVVSDYNYLVGFSVAHEWQAIHGAIRSGSRLVARIPFVCGGEYLAGNLVEADAVTAMIYWSDFAKQVVALPDGSQIQVDPTKVDLIAR